MAYENKIDAGRAAMAKISLKLLRVWLEHESIDARHVWMKILY